MLNAHVNQDRRSSRKVTIGVLVIFGIDDCDQIEPCNLSSCGELSKRARIDGGDKDGLVVVDPFFWGCRIIGYRGRRIGPQDVSGTMDEEAFAEGVLSTWVTMFRNFDAIRKFFTFAKTENEVEGMQLGSWRVTHSLDRRSLVLLLKTDVSQLDKICRLRWSLSCLLHFPSEAVQVSGFLNGLSGEVTFGAYLFVFIWLNNRSNSVGPWWPVIPFVRFEDGKRSMRALGSECFCREGSWEANWDGNKKDRETPCGGRTSVEFWKEWVFGLLGAVVL
jgi:hypothetical protein